MKHIILLIALIIFSSCCRKTTMKTTKTYVHDTTTVTVTEKVIDTVIAGDTIYKEIQIECDSTNTPIIKGGGTAQGKRGSLNTNFRSTAKNAGILSLQSNCDALELKIRYQDSIINRLRLEKTETQIVTQYEKNQGFWNKLGQLGKHILYLALTIVAWEFIRKFLNFLK